MVFSIVLLNTDLTSANVKTKMSVKAFVVNTMGFVDSILAPERRSIDNDKRDSSTTSLPPPSSFTPSTPPSLPTPSTPPTPPSSGYAVRTTSPSASPAIESLTLGPSLMNASEDAWRRDLESVLKVKTLFFQPPPPSLSLKNQPNY
ncbi:hypothetical protein BCR33DRAFT_591136 [Rhizoclosmatium globosum]|uniref:SEC7 domain-containing protein n=1 Tax=Rhizoclosmatium globosum TaxID=329046 RepID=A0A1Y2B1X2_9FUNG|nr:hypothetical protein BCR33DRAFT_591136 [Rhizoclosmatium globosum]|eukprot:ORY28736.1 hypothetical protein BCR33DRAFT_591136 [Rhizoclosmatium globosum]